jgi:hypothetical protein
MSRASRVASRARIRPPTDAIQAALERDLIEWADDVSLRLVWADLLQIEGDPLGRLVVLDHFGETHPRVRPEAEALRQQLGDRLEIPEDDDFTLRWERGFVQTLEVRPRRGDLSTLTRRLCTALRRPALRFLECLHVIVPDAAAGAWPGELLGVAGRSVGLDSHQTLRELHVGDPPRLRERPSGAYERGASRPRYDYTGNDRIAVKFPRLRWVSVAGQLARLACRDGSTETRMHHVDKLATRPLTSRNRTALIRAIWDPSSVVQEAAFATIAKLGPRADFVIEDLELVLRPPIGDRDPRQALALAGLAAIGGASAGLLELVLARDLEPIVGPLPRKLVDGKVRMPALVDPRCVAFLGWVRALGRAGRPALKIVDKLLACKPNEITSQVRGAAKSARKALLAE